MNDGWAEEIKGIEDKLLVVLAVLLYVGGRRNKSTLGGNGNIIS